jgi:hypothetical protein
VDVRQHKQAFTRARGGRFALESAAQGLLFHGVLLV